MPLQELTTRRVSEATSTTLSQSTRSSSKAPRQEACAFSICVVVLPRLLKAYLFNFYVCTQISDASADACMSQAYVFEPSRPLACNNKLVLFYLCLELGCDIFP